MKRPWRAVANGLLLDVRVTPKGGRDAIDGVETLASGQAILKLRVRALPIDGDANASAVALLAKSLKIARSHIVLERGAKARVKTVRIAGDAKSLAAALEAAMREAT